jgi:zinc transporter ZupT
VNAPTLLLILVPFAFLAGGVVVFLAMAGHREFRELHEDAGPIRAARPWWGNPLTWVVACGVLAFLGLVVAPKLFGVAFLLLPFIWIGGFRRRESR